MREFSATARTRANGTPALARLPFTIDGEEYVMRPPKNATLAYVMASMASGKTDSDRIAAMLDFLESTLEQPGRDRLRERLLDGDDELDLEVVEEIIEWAMEEWTGRPPTSPGASSPQPFGAGRPSTAQPSAVAAPTPLP